MPGTAPTVAEGLFPGRGERWRVEKGDRANRTDRGSDAEWAQAGRGRRPSAIRLRCASATPRPGTPVTPDVTLKRKRTQLPSAKPLNLMVGAAGFEPTTPSPPEGRILSKKLKSQDRIDTKTDRIARNPPPSPKQSPKQNREPADLSDAQPQGSRARERQGRSRPRPRS